MARISSNGRAASGSPGQTREPVPHFLIELRPGPVGSLPRLTFHSRFDEVTTIEMGRASVTFVGSCLADGAELRRCSVRALRTGRLVEVTDLPGSFHVLVSSPDVCSIFGDVVGLRRVFYARLGESWLVSDRADALARRIEAPLDDQWLALWLVWPPPPVAASASPWKGVDAVPPGGCIVWRRDKAGPQVETYWKAPRSVVPLEDGAPDLFSALTTAVHERVRRAVAPSLDLSGGKDTVALAFLADEAAGRGAAGTRLLALTLPSVSADNDDAVWAEAVADHLTAVDHVVIPVEECPLPCDDLDDEWLGTDHPSVAAMHSARRRDVADRLRERGSGDGHLAGYGGDEVLQAPLAYVSSLLRQRPLRGLARLRQHCLLSGTSVWPALRTALLPGSYARWLMRSADVSPRRHGDEFGWGVMAPAPPWITSHAIQLATEAIERSARAGPDSSGDIAHHTSLTRIRTGATTVRLHQQFLARHGIRMHCPYLDRPVVESALAVDNHERTDPSGFKPLLDAAMASTVPARFRARPTKSHYTEDTALGLRRNRRQIVQLISGSRLADRGLIDADLLRRAVDRWDPGESLLALADVVSCERWLQSPERAA